MTTAQYLEAVIIDAKRNRLKEELDHLARASITVTVHFTSGQGSTLFKTIGTQAGCEHPDTEAARRLINLLIQRRAIELDALDHQFDKL